MNEINGYIKLNKAQIDAINTIKDNEAIMLDCMKTIWLQLDTNTRWLMIAKTHIEQGCMAMVKSVCSSDDL